MVPKVTANGWSRVFDASPSQCVHVYSFGDPLIVLSHEFRVVVQTGEVCRECGCDWIED